VSTARHDQGTLIASGFIAGGALVGVFAAVLKFIEDRTGTSFVPDLTRLPGIGPALAGWSNWLGLLAFALLSLGVYFISRRAAPEGNPSP